MKIAITLDIAPEYADSDHEMGITTEAFEALLDALSAFGDDIEINKVDDLLDPYTPPRPIWATRVPPTDNGAD